MRELECNRALSTMELNTGADVSMPAFELQDDSFNIHRDINEQKHLNNKPVQFAYTSVESFNDLAIVWQVVW